MKSNKQANEFWRKKISSIELFDALSSLDSKTQIAIYLRYWENKSIQEIADQLSLNWSVVDKMISDSHMILREILEKRLPSEKALKKSAS